MPLPSREGESAPRAAFPTVFRDPRPPPYGPRTVAGLLDVAVAEHPDREALVDGRRRWSYAEVDREADRAARLLWDLGVRPGDRVAAALPNAAEIVFLFLGSTRIGAVWVGVNRALAPPEQQWLLDDAGPAVVFADPETAVGPGGGAGAGAGRERPTVVTVDPTAGSEWEQRWEATSPDRPAVDVSPLAPAAIAYTSGTTGRPKGVVHSQHSILVPAAVIADTRLRGRPERAGVSLPLTVLNLVVLGPVLSFLVGGCCVCVDRSDAIGLARWVREEGIEHLSAAPATVYDLVHDSGVDPDDLRTLHRLGVGGAGCPEELREAYRRRFGHDFTTGYGLTEAPTAVAQESEQAPHRAGASGRAMAHVELRIVGEDGRACPPGVTGEVCVIPARSGPWADVWRPMLGYWGDEERSAEALRGGALHTGDVGRLDADGYLTVEERRSDLILRGGANVSPAEVEAVIRAYPGVADCAVVGRPHPRLGAEVVAVVQPEPGALVDDAGLRDHCAARLARFKVPVTFALVEALPRNPMGKVVRDQALGFVID